MQETGCDHETDAIEHTTCAGRQLCAVGNGKEAYNNCRDPQPRTGLAKDRKTKRSNNLRAIRKSWDDYLIDEWSLRAVRAQLTDEALVVDLADGRSVSVPLVWYPRLVRASMKERQQFRLIGSGEGIHWELLDEDVSVEGIVAGRRSMESAESFRRWLEDRKERA